MKKEYNYPRHGNSPSESTNQQIHADAETNGYNNLFSPTKKTSMSHTTQNTTMKTKTMSLFVLAMFGFLTVFMVGCQKDDDQFEQTPQESLYRADLSGKNLVTDLSKVDESIKQDAIDYYGKVITLSDFPSDKILDISYQEKINQSISKSDIGGTAENALVPLVFDENGVLYTAKRFNQENDQMITKSIEFERSGGEINATNIDQFTFSTKEYLTDLNTFYQVTKLNQANSNYADIVGDIWSFDPYVKFFEKREDKKPVYLNSSLKSGVSWKTYGNIVHARWSNRLSDYTAHTAGITHQYMGTSTNNVTIMKNTSVTEAGGGDYWWSALAVTVATMTSSSGTDKWNESTVYQRGAVWLASLTSSQRSSIISYHASQVGDLYWFSTASTEKNRTDRWYCSKLQWRAYLYSTGIDIDKNAGYTVYPSDIYTNTALVGMSFWLLS